ncbi:MAG: hypothetical protein HY782_22705 [Chloroflexi bacterium]|nr:hypothetical protein [Chloroflexota bacterium]
MSNVRVDGEKKRILLINPPVYDFRLDWARWHQPCGLLQVGSVLKDDHDVRLIDCLLPLKGKQTQRKKLDAISAEEIALARWHFGWSWDQIDSKVQELKEENWIPDVIYITCMMTFWWEATRDLVKHLREVWFPNTRIVLGGVYPTYAPEHAKKNIRGVHFDLEIGKKAKRRATEIGLYDRTPRFAGIFLYRPVSVHAVVAGIEKKVRRGVREFAFFDEEIPGPVPERFAQVLDLIVERGLDIKLRALGNISPTSLTADLVRKMSIAGFRQIFFKDTIVSKTNADDYLAGYEQAVDLLFQHGQYKPRTEDITAMVLVGVPGENIENVAERLMRLSHIVGSVNLVPFQPTPSTEIYEQHKEYLDQIPLEFQNGKLFPFAKYNHATFAVYQELTRLAALLNSKYHSTTFDFLADDEIAQMARKSIAEETWQPKLKETIPLILR